MDQGEDMNVFAALHSYGAVHGICNDGKSARRAYRESCRDVRCAKAAMEPERRDPFRSYLSRDDYFTLEQVSRGVSLMPHLCQKLIELGLVTRALGGYMLTAKGSLQLASGPML